MICFLDDFDKQIYSAIKVMIADYYFHDTVNLRSITKDNINFFEKVAAIVKEENRPLLIFPQGTRVKTNEIIPFKKGAGRIYEALNISCIPIALNSGNVWPKKGILKYPGKITISLLEPIKPGLNRDEFILNLENKIYEEIKNIS